MQNTKPILVFSGWRFPPPIEGAHQFVPMRKPCCPGCGHCGFPADYPLHKKAAWGPPKHILLVGENDAAMAPLRFALRNSGPCYTVTSANSADESCNLLAEGLFDMMLVQLPVTPLEPFLERVNKIDNTFPVLIMNVINKPAMAEILDRIKVMTARKPGPKPGSHHREKAV